MGVISSYIYTLFVDNHLVLLPPNHFPPLLSRLPLMNNCYRPMLNLRSDEHKMAVKERKDFSDIQWSFAASTRDHPSKLENTRIFHNRPYCIKIAWGYPVEFEPAGNADPIKLCLINIIMLTNFLF